MLNEWVWMLKYYFNKLYGDFFGLRKTFTDWRGYWKKYYQYKQAAPISMQPLVDYLFPCLGDDTGETIVDPTYYYQDAWVFEKIIQQQPKTHVDIGSHHKFVALLSKVIPVTMVDIRPLSLPLDSLKFLEGSILNLPFEDESVPSLSSLCVVEHIGLGRYGDPIDPWGSEKSVKELIRVVKKGGHLYISVPVDKINKVYYNAHRAFTREYFINLFSKMILVEEIYIYGKNMYPSYDEDKGFGTGLFHFVKPVIK
jgi:SAM-dependent methyltransferase